MTNSIPQCNLHIDFCQTQENLRKLLSQTDELNSKNTNKLSTIYNSFLDSL
jgi:hypothetical protein